MMDDFVEVPTDVSAFLATEHKYRLFEPLQLVLAFYALWEKATLLNDWDAYREMLSDKFPSEWTDVAPPGHCFKDESLIPAEFIMFPIGMDDEPEERHALRGVLSPDDMSVAAWLGAKSEKEK